MQQFYYTPLLATTYGSNAYDNANYNGTNVGTTAGGGASGGSNGGATGSGLTNTGTAILGIVSLAALIVLVAMVIRIWKRPNKAALQTPSEEA